MRGPEPPALDYDDDDDDAYTSFTFDGHEDTGFWEEVYIASPILGTFIAFASLIKSNTSLSPGPTSRPTLPPRALLCVNRVSGKPTGTFSQAVINAMFEIPVNLCRLLGWGPLYITICLATACGSHDAPVPQCDSCRPEI